VIQLYALIEATIEVLTNVHARFVAQDEALASSINAENAGG
jgi:hypothetical protein